MEFIMESLIGQRSEENNDKIISLAGMSFTTLQILELVIIGMDTLNVPDRFVSYITINRLYHEVDNGKYKEEVSYQELMEDFHKHTIFKVIENDKFNGEILNLIANTKVDSDKEYIKLTLNKDIAPYYEALKETYKQIKENDKQRQTSDK